MWDQQLHKCRQENTQSITLLAFLKTFFVLGETEKCHCLKTIYSLRATTTVDIRSLVAEWGITITWLLWFTIRSEGALPDWSFLASWWCQDRWLHTSLKSLGNKTGVSNSASWLDLCSWLWGCVLYRRCLLQFCSTCCFAGQDNLPSLYHRVLTWTWQKLTSSWTKQSSSHYQPEKKSNQPT